MLEKKLYSIVEAPCNLGLRAKGVETLPAALLEAGLAQGLSAARATSVPCGKYNPVRDFDTLLLNPDSIASYARALAPAVERVLRAKRLPIVIGGDRSTLLGSLLALRRRGRFGLLFISGHASFYQPAVNPDGEVVHSTLAIATGRGPRELTRLDDDYGERLIRDQDVAVLGVRDEFYAAQMRCQPLSSEVTALDLAAVRRSGIAACVARALDRLASSTLDGYWIHFDADVLSDDVNPAVDHRLAGGLSWEDCELALRMAWNTGKAMGVQVTTLNPRLDVGGRIVPSLARMLIRALSHGSEASRPETVNAPSAVPPSPEVANEKIDKVDESTET